MTKNSFVVRYTNRDIMDMNKDILSKLNEVHTDVKIVTSKVRFHTKLIFGAYAFTALILAIMLKINV